MSWQADSLKSINAFINDVIKTSLILRVLPKNIVWIGTLKNLVGTYILNVYRGHENMLLK